MDVQCPKCGSRHFPASGPLSDGLYQATCLKCNTDFKFKSSVTPKANVTFTINGKSYTVGSEGVSMRLASFIRDTAGLTGTKTMCYEGGCGACVVSATLMDPVTKRQKTAAINSCLCPVLNCDGWEITTTEGLGSSRRGLHTIQQKIADYNGTQCGYCTSGMVMNMYSLITETPSLSQQQVEDAFDGQICRCTGFRSILDAMRSLAHDAPDSVDIEDLTSKCSKLQCGKSACCKKKDEPLLIMASGAPMWLRPTSLPDLYNVLEQHSKDNIRMVVGNTGTGVYKSDGPYNVYVDTKAIPDLYVCNIGQQIQIGANVTLFTLISIFTQVKGQSGFEYCGDLADHIKRVASTPVRNFASWAGNLMLKHAHPEFPSDMFVILEAANAQITVGSKNGNQTVSPSQLLDLDMTQKVILQMTLQPMVAPPGQRSFFKSFKITPRTQNAHAYVNAALSMVVKDADMTVTAKPRLLFGGFNKTLRHATRTEDYLVNKCLCDAQILATALQTLTTELIPDDTLPGPSKQYRQTVGLALFYKAVLGILGDRAPPEMRSGALNLQRPLSTGQEVYQTDKAKWPITEPMPKKTAGLQASGEAEYINDIPAQRGQLYAAFVLTTQGNATLQSVDPAEALAVPGVECYLSADDIPSAGINNFSTILSGPEEVFCTGKVLYAGQPIGIIVADAHYTAMSAANLVHVTYSDIQPPILTIQDAIKAGSFFPTGDPIIQGDADGAITKAAHQLSGEVGLGTQYHFHMETQSCLCVPGEGCMDVFPSTQWPDSCQIAIANVIGVPSSRIKVSVKRLGGAYGGKITRNAWIAAGCGLAAHVTNRPVNLQMSLQANMEMIGKRCPYLGKYKVGFDDNGKLCGVDITYYNDCGCSPNESTATYTMLFGDNAYHCENWKLTPKEVMTNTPSTTSCRAPGSVPGIFIMETIMEQIAKSLNKDSSEIRALNFYTRGQVTPYKMPLTYCSLQSVWQQLNSQAQVKDRRKQVEQFNKANRWKKRGLSVIPMKYGIDWSGAWYNCFLAVYCEDGSVAISHGGVEIGQGVNTKVIQVCASSLGIPMSEVTVQPTESLSNANTQATGGSITSEVCCMAVLECCDQIKKRLAPIRAQQTKDLSWKDLIAKAYLGGVDLCARYMTYPPSSLQPPGVPFRYNSYGVTCTEVELDVLTGENQILRTDMLLDCGESTNPLIDIGQIQGAFVMGIGYYLLEKTQYDPQTGQNVTSGTWDYHPPTSKDIPIDFRIQLLKDAPNPKGVLGAKACAEPPLCMSCSTLFALQDAIYAARCDAGNTQAYIQDAPCTVDIAQEYCLTTAKQMTA